MAADLRAPSEGVPNVLFVTGHWPPAQGGMATSADRIVRGLREDGVEVDVLHLSSRARASRGARMPGGRELVWPVGSELPEDLAALLPALGRRGRPWQVVVAFGGPLPVFVGPTLAGWLGVPLVVALRGADIDTGMFHPRRVVHLERALRRADLVVAVSGDKVHKVRALGCVAPVRVVPNGIDLADWEPLPSDRMRAARLRTEVGGPDDGVVVGCVGHLKRKKGVAELAQAIVDVELQEVVRLVLAGDATPDVVAAIDAQVDRGLVVHRLPFVDRERLLGVLPAFDVVALPSVHDGMPNVMLEAGGLGLPLLASRAGGMGDHLEDGVHGWLFDPGDQAGLQRAVWRMHRDRARFTAFGRAWQDRVRTCFTSEHETAAWRAALSLVTVVEGG